MVAPVVATSLLIRRRASVVFEAFVDPTILLAGAKIWLEHGIDPRFVIDKHPDKRLPSWNAGR